MAGTPAPHTPPTSGRPETRLTDAERERVTDVLRTAVADGRLDLPEFEERVARVYGARVPSDLSGVLDDLGTSTPPTVPRRPPRPLAGAAAAVLAIGVVVLLGVLVTPHLLWLLWVAIPFAKTAALRALPAVEHRAPQRPHPWAGGCAASR